MTSKCQNLNQYVFEDVKVSFPSLLKTPHSSFLCKLYASLKTLLSLLGLYAIFNDCVNPRQYPKQYLVEHLSLCYPMIFNPSFTSENLSFPKLYKLFKGRNGDAARWLHQVAMKRSGILGTVSSLASLFTPGACYNAVAGLVILPGPRGHGQARLNHLTTNSRL